MRWISDVWTAGRWPEGLNDVAITSKGIRIIIQTLLPIKKQMFRENALNLLKENGTR